MGRVLTIELSEDEFRALEQAAQARGATPEAEATARLRSNLGAANGESMTDRLLVEAGLMSKVATGKTAVRQRARFMTAPVTGKAVSASIIEERR